jgi:hypothetical protein
VSAATASGPDRGLSEQGPRTVRVGEEDVVVWPEGQLVQELDPAIKLTRFEDWPRVHEALVPRLLEEEATLRRESPPPNRTSGGAKLRRPDLWGVPEMDLLTERAKALFRRTLGCRGAVVDACWANVYRKWESIGPHSHRRAVASIVYSVDEGDPDPGCRFSGRFSFVDPRLEACCQLERGRMTNPLFPNLAPGIMMIFPAQTLHWVAAYAGERPRITLSWNLNPESLPGSVTDAFPALAEIGPRGPRT